VDGFRFHEFEFPYLKKMKILHIISSLDPKCGGTTEAVVQLSKALIREGAECEAVCLDPGFSAWLNDSPFRIHALGPGKGGFQYSPRLLAWLQQNLVRYDVAILHGLWQYPGRALWLASGQGRFPYFVFPHGMLDPWFARTFPGKHLKKIAYWMLNERHVLAKAQAVLFTSEDEMLLAPHSFPGYQVRGKITGFGIETPKGNADQQKQIFLAKYPELVGKRIVLFLGRLHPKKGCEYLAEAMAEACANNLRLHLVFAGPCDDPAYKSRLESLAPKNRTTWTGMIRGDLRWGAMRAAEVFALPSHQENFGMAVVESLACGCPVLLSKRVNIWREVVSSGGGFAGEDNLEGMRAVLGRWLQLSPAERDVMQTRSVEAFNRHFRIEDAALRILDVLEGEA
jgi:glycosyltransferase involved in cell wall biosynthesis